MIRAYAAEGEHEAAIASARRYLAIDDLAEEVHRRLIDLYTAQGDRSAALRQYERCVAILDRELGMDPLPETREVYQAVLEEPGGYFLNLLTGSKLWYSSRAM